MTLDEAKKLLTECIREELRDHAFGDAEVYWMKDGQEEAAGYFGSKAEVEIRGTIFKGPDAHELRKCGTIGAVERNDSTGPDQYVEGQCMPGLTIEGVRKELTGE